MTAQTFQYSIQ